MWTVEGKGKVGGEVDRGRFQRSSKDWINSNKIKDWGNQTMRRGDMKKNAENG